MNRKPKRDGDQPVGKARKREVTPRESGARYARRVAAESDAHRRQVSQRNRRRELAQRAEKKSCVVTGVSILGTVALAALRSRGVLG